ncbi:MAG: DUF1501 domain-containing protein [Planctomycetaceae bacterium]
MVLAVGPRCKLVGSPWVAWLCLRLLQAEQAAGVSKNNKGIIMIFLPGGPPHQDMWDLKVDAPAEIRGEFSPISTNVPGIEICELFPLLAQQADKYAIIRSIEGQPGRISPFNA